MAFTPSCLLSLVAQSHESETESLILAVGRNEGWCLEGHSVSPSGESQTKAAAVLRAERHCLLCTEDLGSSSFLEGSKSSH